MHEVFTNPVHLLQKIISANPHRDPHFSPRGFMILDDPLRYRASANESVLICQWMLTYRTII
jgi:hypothetical protein